MRISRVATYSAALIALGGLVTVPAAIAASQHPARPSAASPVIGHIGYLSGEKVKIATVHANGKTSGVATVGPVTKVKSPHHVQIFDLIASSDGAWMSWQEIVFAHNGDEIGTARLVLRQQSTGKIHRFMTEQSPVGFSSDQLITFDGNSVRRLDLTPSPHFVKEFSDIFPLAAYAHGVVETDNSSAPKGLDQTWKVELHSFAGAHAVLHSYVLGPTTYSIPDQAWVSNDGKHVVIERGDHTDFGGLGPSSLADEFRLTGSHKRNGLGHYGTAGAKWRVASVSFAGPKDQVWAEWERETAHGAVSVVAVRRDGTWAPVTNHGIAVAGNRAGYVITQPGKWVSVGTDSPVFDTVPTSQAKLRHGSTVRTLRAEGSVFVWIA
jgi:hypothetical protein